MRERASGCGAASEIRLFTNPLTVSPLAFTASQPKQKHSRAKSRQLRRRITLSVLRTENCPNWEARCSKTTKRNEKFYDQYIKWSFKGTKCTLLLIHFVLRDPENLSVTTRYITFWRPAKIACLRCRLFPNSRPGRSKLQQNSAKQRLGSIEM